MSLDALWKVLWKMLVAPYWPEEIPLAKMIAQRRNIPLVSAVEMLGLASMMVWAIYDVFSTNRIFLKSIPIFHTADTIVDWLRQYDSSEYFTRIEYNWNNAAAANQMHFLDSWYHLDLNDVGTYDGDINPWRVVAEPNYLIIGSQNEVGYPDPIPVKVFESGFTIYWLPNSLPFAFSVASDKLSTPISDKLKREDVTVLNARANGANSFQVTANGRGDEILVLMVANDPGWQVSVDGKRQELLRVGRYLATEIRPGEHQYTFTYKPLSFMIGLFISLISLGCVLGLVASDMGIDWRKKFARLRVVTALHGIFNRFLPTQVPRQVEAETTPASDHESHEPIIFNLAEGDELQVQTPDDSTTWIIIKRQKTLGQTPQERSPDTPQTIDEKREDL